jgi:hypothetical protein
MRFLAKQRKSSILTARGDATLQEARFILVIPVSSSAFDGCAAGHPCPNENQLGNRNRE